MAKKTEPVQAAIVSITVEGPKTEAMVVAAEILSKFAGELVVREMQEAGAVGKVVLEWSGTV